MRMCLDRNQPLEDLDLIGLGTPSVEGLLALWRSGVIISDLKTKTYDIISVQVVEVLHEPSCISTR